MPTRAPPMIDWLLRVAVAVTFAWSAYAKLRGPSAPLVSGERVPTAVSRRSPQILAAVEALVALLVLVPATRVAGGVAAAILGGLFVVVLGARWSRGESRMRCGCFGSDSERPAWLAVLRAGAVMVAGLLVALSAGTHVSRATAVDASLVVLGLAVVVLAILVLALYRHVGVLERRLGPRTALELADEGPAFGVRAPELDGLRRSGSELVAFGSDSCRLCRELTPGLRALTRDGLNVRGVDESAEPDVFSRYRVPGTPYVVHLYDGVVVAKGLVNTLEQIEELVGVGLERAQHG
jgi:hypothetical protein